MKSETREKANKAFRSLLENQFSKDLDFVSELTAVHESKRSPEQNGAIISLGGKYSRGGKCSSLFFSRVSEKLKKEYKIIHDEICMTLYGPS